MRRIVLLACLCASLVSGVQVAPAGAADPVSAGVTIDAPDAPDAGVAAPISAAATGDPPPVITSYTWSGADATFTDPAAASTTVTFGHGGAHTVTMTAVTDGGDTLTSTVEVAVHAADPVVAVDGPDSATTDQQVQLQAQASGGSGAVDSVTWDLDGDGAYDDAQGAQITAAFPAPGTATPRARVTTDDGGSGEGSRSIAVARVAVAEAPPPAAAPPATTPPPTGAPVVATVVLGLGRVAVTTLETVLRRGLTVPVQMAGAGRVTLTLALSKAVARRLHVSSPTIATKSTSIGAGVTNVHVRIPKILRRALARVRRPVLTITATTRLPGGRVARSATSIRLR